ncbi:DUF1707 domain-containing protein [Terrabacter sp. BE26]|uniref:DUF1707 SHOCT-like domain-containing protein n=1 Tax=Terrabacter sp. BE26 TaxID=2898152 RepID=UPI0035BE3AE5
MDDGEIRISSAEREQALAALAEHHAAGRLDANEYEDRRGRANDAVVRREITSLFVDLPEPRPELGQPTGSSPGSSPGSTVGSSVGVPASSAPAPHTPPAAPSSPRAKLARTLVSLSPFIALGAFIVTRSWLAFLLVPVIAILARTFDQ